LCHNDEAPVQSRGQSRSADIPTALSQNKNSVILSELSKFVAPLLARQKDSAASHVTLSERRASLGESNGRMDLHFIFRREI
jgi:hypothetical protein